MPVLEPSPPSVVAETLDILTLDEAKLALNIPLADETFDAELASYVTAVSQRIDDLVGPVVKRAVTGEIHSGDRNMIWPAVTPVASMTTVTEYVGTVATVLTAETLGAAPTGAYQLVTANGYAHDVTLYRRESGGDSRWAAGRGNIRLDYIAGRFDTTADVTPKFKQGAAKMLSLQWRGDQGAGTVTFGGFPEEGQFIVGFVVPKAVRDLLESELVPSGIA